MRRAGLVFLITPLILTACGEGGPPLQRSADAPVAAPAATADQPSADQVRTDILAALAAHPAGLEADSPPGRAVLHHFPPADCRDAGTMDGMPFDRLCAWGAQADQDPDISLMIADGLILGAVVRGRPEGVRDWDCQPASAPPDHTICMATRVSSAQSGAWNDYWTALARR